MLVPVLVPVCLSLRLFLYLTLCALCACPFATLCALCPWVPLPVSFCAITCVHLCHYLLPSCPFMPFVHCVPFFHYLPPFVLLPPLCYYLLTLFAFVPYVPFAP